MLDCKVLVAREFNYYLQKESKYDKAKNSSD